MNATVTAHSAAKTKAAQGLPRRRRQAANTWDEKACQRRIDQLWLLRTSMLENESALAPWLDRITPG